MSKISSSHFFNSISYTKDIDQYTEGEIQKDYVPFVINRMVSQYSDLIHFAEAMNTSYDIKKEHQLDFYNAVIPKKKRRVLWSYKKKQEDIEMIMELYNVSFNKASEYRSLLSDNDIEDLKKLLETGGK